MIKGINESFKKMLKETKLPEAKSDKENLRTALELRAMNMMDKRIANLKAYEIAFQEVIEQMFPDNSWWEVTDCNIFMSLFNGKDVYKTIDEIIDGFKLDECLTESDKPAATSIEDAQKWVDYDMKHYGHISEETNDLVKRAGFQIVKDTYGDYEVTAGKYDESLKEDVNLANKEINDIIYNSMRSKTFAKKHLNDLEKYGIKVNMYDGSQGTELVGPNGKKLWADERSTFNGPQEPGFDRTHLKPYLYSSEYDKKSLDEYEKELDFLKKLDDYGLAREYTKAKTLDDAKAYRDAEITKITDRIETIKQNIKDDKKHDDKAIYSNREMKTQTHNNPYKYTGRMNSSKADKVDFLTYLTKDVIDDKTKEDIRKLGLKTDTMRKYDDLKNEIGYAKSHLDFENKHYGVKSDDEIENEVAKYKADLIAKNDANKKSTKSAEDRLAKAKQAKSDFVKSKLNKNESLKENSTDIVYFKEMPDDHYVDVDFIFDDFESNWPGIVITGNDRLKDFGVEQFEDIFSEYDRDEDIVAALEEKTGKKYDVALMRGYYQSDWQGVYYPVEDEKYLDELEDYYFGKVKEYIDEEEGTSYLVLDDIVWKGTDAIKKELSEQSGIPVENIKIRKFNGYTRTANYVDEKLNKNESLNESAVYLSSAVDLYFDDEETKNKAIEKLKNSSDFTIDKIGDDYITVISRGWSPEINKALSKELGLDESLKETYKADGMEFDDENDYKEYKAELENHLKSIPSLSDNDLRQEYREFKGSTHKDDKKVFSAIEAEMRKRELLEKCDKSN